MPKSTTPTTLTVDLLEKEGWTVRRVDHRHPFANRMVDLLGVADLLAMSPDKGLMLVQLTSHAQRRSLKGSNIEMRRSKILASSDARTWVASGGRLRLIGWLKAPKGETGLVPHVEEFSVEDFADAAGGSDDK